MTIVDREKEASVLNEQFKQWEVQVRLEEHSKHCSKCSWVVSGRQSDRCIYGTTLESAAQQGRKP